MRKTAKLGVKCLLGLGIIAALVTLLSPQPFLDLHPRLQETNTTPSTPPQRLHLHHLALGGEIGDNETKGTTNETLHNLLKKSQPEVRVEAKVEGSLVGQKELRFSDTTYIQNPPPKDWVEVKKINRNVLKGGGEKSRKTWRGGQKDNRRSFKVVGHSPKELQDRALTFPEDSPLRIFLKEQARRVAHVSAACLTFNPSIADIVAGSRGPPVGLLSIKHIIYDRLNQLTFCPVYKAASTSWTLTLMQLAGLLTTRAMDHLPVQKLVKMFYPKLSGLAASSVTRNTTHFMVVRHPLGRLLSCYLDKFQNASKDYYYHLYGEKIITRYRPSLARLPANQVTAMKEEVRVAMRKGGPINLPDNPFATPLGPTFPEFVEHVINTRYDDEHWRTYTAHCAPCSLTYDFVLRFESLQEENKWFLEYLNRSGEVTPRHDNHNPGGDTKTVSCDYYSQLSLLQIDSLAAKYRKDLLLYEYDVEDYRKCAKDYGEVTSKNGAVAGFSGGGVSSGGDGGS